MVLLAAFAADARAQTPSEVIAALNDGLLGVMRRADELGYAGRVEALAPVIADTYDSAAMARIAAGQHWAGLTPEQRARLVDAFRDYTVSSYAARFDGYAGERFETLGERATRRDDVLVETRIVTGDGEAVPISYLLREGEDGWRVIDVLLDNSVSELALRRSEYGSLLAREGLDGLLRELDEAVARNAADG